MKSIPTKGNLIILNAILLVAICFLIIAAVFSVTCENVLGFFPPLIMSIVFAALAGIYVAVVQAGSE